MKNLTDGEKTRFMRSALGMAGVAVNDFVAEMIWRMNEGIQEKGGDFSLKDAVKIETMLSEKYEAGKKLPSNSSIKAKFINIIENFALSHWRKDAIGKPNIIYWLETIGIDDSALFNSSSYEPYIIATIEKMMKEYEHSMRPSSRESIVQFVANELSTTK